MSAVCVTTPNAAIACTNDVYLCISSWFFFLHHHFLVIVVAVVFVKMFGNVCEIQIYNNTKEKKKPKKLQHASNEIKHMNTKWNISLFHMCESLACWVCVCVYLVRFISKIVRTHAQHDLSIYMWKTKRIKKKREEATKKTQLMKCKPTQFYLCERQNEKIYTLYNHAHVTFAQCIHGTWTRTWKKPKHRENADVKRVYTVQWKKKRFAFTMVSLRFSTHFHQEIHGTKKYTWTRCIRCKTEGYFLSCFCQHAKKTFLSDNIGIHLWK